MRCITKRIALMAAALMIVVVPVLADEGSFDNKFQGRQPEKNECLLVARNCPDQVDTIQQRIDRIKGEISRGTDVYSNDELRRLNMKLDEAVKTLEEMSVGG
jgi:predicted nuclease with TOPRIM domain